jgi:hypothetical protein
LTADDIARVEQALGITLPASYRARMVPYPIRAAEGNADLGVWDNAERIVELNLELRRGAAGGVKPWPSRFFALGHPGDGSPYALDLDAGDAVWWVDRSHLDNPSSAKESDSFAAWADRYFRILRTEMAGNLVDPDGTPQQRAMTEKREARSTAIGCAIFLAIVIAIIVAIRWLIGAMR